MTFFSALPFCILMLITMSGWHQADDVIASPNVNKNFKCIVQDPEESAKSLPEDVDEAAAEMDINSNYTVKDCAMDGNSFCYEMTGCRVDVKGFVIHNAGRRGCVQMQTNYFELGFANPNFCTTSTASKNCNQCRVCQEDMCNQQWLDYTVTVPPATPTTTESSTIKEENAPRKSSTSSTQKSTAEPFSASTDPTTSKTAAPVSGSIGTAPVSAMMALLGLLALGAVMVF